MKEKVDLLNKDYESKTAQELLAAVLADFGKHLVVASSLGAEDQVITDMVLKLYPKARIFILDTGRLHQETYAVIDASMKKYGHNYEIYFPDTKSVQDMVSQKGMNHFYTSVDNRKECCFFRKVEPINRVLGSADAWVTGLRATQSVTRTTLQKAEWDLGHEMIKLNPLADWSDEDVWAYIHKNDVPVNALHEQGYPSIGCAPCTRAIEPGEDLRAGRWWWESADQKECGLHVVDGKLVRKSNEKKESFD